MVGEGAQCPCCDRFTKVYDRKLNSSMALALVLLYQHGKGEWVHLFDFLQERKAQHSDAAQLRHWGLIEESTEEGPNGSPRSGYYRLTLLGALFVERRASVARSIFVYNDEVRGRSEEVVTIVEALGTSFSYDELFGPVDMSAVLARV